MSNKFKTESNFSADKKIESFNLLMPKSLKKYDVLTI